jgi:hypothetical protein
MVKEDHGLRQGSGEPRQRTVSHRVKAVLGLGIVGFLLYGIGCGPQFGDRAARQPASRLFHDWPKDRKPIFVLLVSGQQHGYLQPCGCSPIQYGGLERRFNVIQELKQKYNCPIVAVDLGDIPQPRGPQKLLKYVTSMEALKRLDYLAVGIGEKECLLPLLDGLANFALNNNNQPPHVLAGNLSQRTDNFPGAEAIAIEGGIHGILKVGFTSFVAPSVAQVINDPTIRFSQTALPQLIKELQTQQTQFKVLLYQGTEHEARQCAATHADFQVIVHLSQEEEPTEKAAVVGNTMLVNVGHKGRYIGLVGVYPSNQVAGKPFELYYQLLKIGPEYKTPPGQDASNPILALMEEYARKVKDQNFLQHFPQAKHPIQLQFPNAKYVGSEACKKCHEYAYDVWKRSKHAQAFQTLVDAKRPSLRQFDGECVVCHLTGFEYLTGYRNDKDTPKLKDVGCESCHGPGSEHADKANPNRRNPQLLQLMNPYKTPVDETADQKQQRMLRLNVFCQHCHDTDNDINWNIPPVKPGDPPRRWPDIIHMNPKE